MKNEEKKRALDTQVGEDHYKDFVIQPTEFIHRNGIGFIAGCVIKRMCRYDKKGSAYEDLEKSKHEIDMLIELEELEPKNIKEETYICNECGYFIIGDFCQITHPSKPNRKECKYFEVGKRIKLIREKKNEVS